MSKKWIVIIALCIGMIGALYFFVFRTSEPVAPSISSTSLEEQICEKVTVQFGDCKQILMYDATSKLVFAESSSGIIPVLTNQEFTDVKELIYPMMDFQEFNEEKVERGPIDWRAAKHVEKDFSIIYGFAEDDAKTLVINSEGHIQPNRFKVRDNLWVWYAAFQKDEVKLPVEVTVYDAKGQVISGGNEEE